MTAQEKTDLALLKQRMNALESRFSVVEGKIDTNSDATFAIKETLDNLSGGKQALMWITGFLVSIGVIIATYLGVHKT